MNSNNSSPIKTTKLEYLKAVFISSDFLISITIAIILYLCLPKSISNQFAKEIYDIGISVLSIVFSVYFAALSIVISSSDNSFTSYLQKIGAYTFLINIYRFTLFLLFIALMISILVYVITLFLEEVDSFSQRKYLFVIFVFLFLWGLLASLSIGLNTLKYALMRAKYVNTNTRCESDYNSSNESNNN